MALITVTIPSIDPLVEGHHRRAVSEIERMSPSRQFGAETDLSSWRRLLRTVDLEKTNGYAFSGNLLQAGAIAEIEDGKLIIAVDKSWTRANWYAGRHVRAVEISARLLQVRESGLVTLIESQRSRAWAQDILGFLETNENLCKTGNCRLFGLSRPKEADRPQRRQGNVLPLRRLA